MIRNKHESEHGEDGALRRYNSDQIDTDLLNDFMRASSKTTKDSLFTLSPMPRST